MIAALFVQRGGVYWNLPGVDPWDEERDARLYGGPWPVVAHPPCERWGKYWYGQAGTPVGSPKRKKLGDDGGCFASALASVRRWGGVLEHPEGSAAWPSFGLITPPQDGGWVVADFMGGWTCCVEQGKYGHRARKMTWLYAHGVEIPSLTWGKAGGKIRLEAGYHSAAERREKEGARKAARHRNTVEWLSKKMRAATPLPFRDLLLSIAASSRVAEVA